MKNNTSLKFNFSKVKKHKLILIGHEHYNPLGLIRSIGEQGLLVNVIMIRGDYKFASKSKYINNLYYVGNLNEALEILIKKYGNEKYRPFVFACADITTDFLNTNFDLLKDRFYFFNSGEDKLINKYMSKYQQVELAKSVGMNVLWTKEISNQLIPKDIIYPIITKAIDSRVSGWKQQSFICNNEQELKSALSRIKAEKIILQQFIHKKNELGIDGYSIKNGKDVAFTFAYNYKYIRDGSFSHYMNIFTPTDDNILKLASDFLRRMKYEGIFDIEFLEDQDGKLYFCEINLRNSGWSYASTTNGMPLPILWALDTLNGKISRDYQIQIPEGYIAMEGFDYLRGKEKGQKGLGTFAKDFVRTDCHFILNSKDMRPFWAYIGSIFLRKCRKIRFRS